VLLIAQESFDSPCDPVARKTLPRPPHPVPYVRDDRETPLCVGRDGGTHRDVSTDHGSEIFLQKGLDSPVHKPPDGQINRHAPPPGLFDVGDRVGNKRVSKQMPCRCIFLRGPVTCLGAGSGAPAQVGLVEIITKGIHKAIQS
jgi:hypothetical protein